MGKSQKAQKINERIGRKWVRVRGVGKEARIATHMFCGFFMIAIIATPDADGQGWGFERISFLAILVVFVFSSIRIGIWVSESEVMFRQYWRTLILPREGLRIEWTNFSGLANRHGRSELFAMLVVTENGHEIPLQYTMARWKKCRQLARLLSDRT
ncbi:MAG: hypothetical protein LBB54_05690 [Cellulomonadaceae bacterium]|jgi:hypothetical protein|nr:hypothetical protein [Cellulomonadaceae bacterium]